MVFLMVQVVRQLLAAVYLDMVSPNPSLRRWRHICKTLASGAFAAAASHVGSRLLWCATCVLAKTPHPKKYDFWTIGPWARGLFT